MATLVPITDKCKTAAIVALVLLMKLSESLETGRLETMVSQISAGPLFFSETTGNQFYSQNSMIFSKVKLYKNNKSHNRLVEMNDIACYSSDNDLRINSTQLFQSPRNLLQTYWWKHKKTINQCKSKSRIHKMTKAIKENETIKRVKRGHHNIEINGKLSGSISNALSTARRKSFKNARNNTCKATKATFDKINSELLPSKLCSIKHSKTNFYGQNRMTNKSTSLKLIIKNVTFKNNSFHKKTFLRSTSKIKTGSTKHGPKIKVTNKQIIKLQKNVTGKVHTPKNRLKLNKSMSAKTKGLKTGIIPNIGASTRSFEILPGGYFKVDEQNYNDDNDGMLHLKHMLGVTPHKGKTMKNDNQFVDFEDDAIFKNKTKISHDGYGYDDYQDTAINQYNDVDIGSGYYDSHFNYSYGIKNEIYNILVFNFFTTTLHVPLFCPTAPRTTVLCPRAPEPVDLIRETILFDYNVVVTAAVTGSLILLISLCLCMSCGTRL